MGLRSVSFLSCRHLRSSGPRKRLPVATTASAINVALFRRTSRMMGTRRGLTTGSGKSAKEAESTANLKAPEVEVKALELEGAELEGGILEGSIGKNLGQVHRHGKGDAIITLDVGGKEFRTLRSTVNSNPVLADHVARAEANRQKSSSGAVFIDRDPTHFGFILTYLRNKVEMLSYAQHSSISLRKFSATYARLPQDRDVLSDLYIEASYYRIKELQELLTRTGWFIKLVDVLGAGNPFDAATKWMSRLRNLMVAFTAFGSLGGTVLLTMQYDFDLFLRAIGLREKKKEESKGGNYSILEALKLAKKPTKKEPPSIIEAIEAISKK